MKFSLKQACHVYNTFVAEEVIGVIGDDYASKPTSASTLAKLFEMPGFLQPIERDVQGRNFGSKPSLEVPALKARIEAANLLHELAEALMTGVYSEVELKEQRAASVASFARSELPLEVLKEIASRHARASYTDMVTTWTPPSWILAAMVEARCTK